MVPIADASTTCLETGEIMSNLPGTLLRSSHIKIANLDLVGQIYLALLWTQRLRTYIRPKCGPTTASKLYIESKNRRPGGDSIW